MKNNNLLGTKDQLIKKLSKLSLNKTTCFYWLIDGELNTAFVKVDLLRLYLVSIPDNLLMVGCLMPPMETQSHDFNRLDHNELTEEQKDILLAQEYYASIGQYW